MNRTFAKISLSLLATLACLPLVAQPVPDDPDAIVEEIVDNLRGGGMHATLELEVERSDRTIEYSLETISDGAERSLIRVTAPPRDAGQAFLSLGDQLFIYTPRLGRVLRLPPSGANDSFLGSDLSYNDLAGDDIRENYDASVASRSGEEIVLSLHPTAGAPTPYGELRFAATLPGLAPLKLTFFDQRGTEVKRVLFEEIVTLENGKLFPMRLVVEDLTADGGRTVARYTDGDYDFAVPESCFTQRALERGCL
ncbi:MAG TPA: outer membrane lipoprotein-sorting protein [Trueperaceae bacterium]